MSRFYLGQRAVKVAFDDEKLVANAGLSLISALCTRIGLAEILTEKVRLGTRVGGTNPAYKSLTLIHAMVAGASHIDHLDVPRSGASGSIPPFHVAVPSTTGTYSEGLHLRHLRQLDAVIEAELDGAWKLGLAPQGDRPLVVDVDSTIAEVSGYQKKGAAYGYTHKLGYHPLLTRADTGEILAARMRKGSANTQRGIKRHVSERVARLRRLEVRQRLILRFDSGYQSQATLDKLSRRGVSYTMAIHANAKGAKEIVAAIAEEAWTPIEYTSGGEAQVAETTYRGRCLIVRRTRLIGAQAEALPQLAPLRLCHRSGGLRRRAGRLPPGSCPGGAVHTGSQGERRHNLIRRR